MKILCVGRNYAKHARELGNAAPTGEPPIWFWKPPSSIIGEGEELVLPPAIGPVHHEVELALRVGRQARRVAAADALRHIDAITVANDATARELQQRSMAKGLPWAQAKGYDTFLPLGGWVPWQPGGTPLDALKLRLTVNGEARQDGFTGDMIHSIPALIEHASHWTTLEPGDIILTGTPDGVGPMPAGSRVECAVVGVATLRHHVVEG
ncbi:MAG: fumarylacetoacetate hydrolase family protein [Thermoplasmatota archaeon]